MLKNRREFIVYRNSLNLDGVNQKYSKILTLIANAVAKPLKFAFLFNIFKIKVRTRL